MTNVFGGIGKSYTNTPVTAAPCHTMNQATTKVYPPKLSVFGAGHAPYLNTCRQNDYLHTICSGVDYINST